MLLNCWMIEKQLRISVAQWPHVTNPPKPRKYGWRSGIAGDIRMYRDVVRGGPIELYRQFRAMREQSVSPPRLPL
jgi:hypothetical protein